MVGAPSPARAQPSSDGQGSSPRSASDGPGSSRWAPTNSAAPGPRKATPAAVLGRPSSRRKPSTIQRQRRGWHPMSCGRSTVIREPEEPVASKRGIAAMTTIRGTYSEKAREVGAGDVFWKRAVGRGTPFSVECQDPKARSCLCLRERMRMLRLFFQCSAPSAPGTKSRWELSDDRKFSKGPRAGYDSRRGKNSRRVRFRNEATRTERVVDAGHR